MISEEWRHTKTIAFFDCDVFIYYLNLTAALIYVVYKQLSSI